MAMQEYLVGEVAEEYAHGMLDRREAVRRLGLLGVGAAAATSLLAGCADATAALVKANLTHEVVTYDGVDHAFFNDTGPRYNAAAADQAWTKLQSWFATQLA